MGMHFLSGLLVEFRFSVTLEFARAYNGYSHRIMISGLRALEDFCWNCVFCWTNFSELSLPVLWTPGVVHSEGSTRYLHDLHIMKSKNYNKILQLILENISKGICPFLSQVIIVITSIKDILTKYSELILKKGICATRVPFLQSKNCWNNLNILINGAYALVKLRKKY